MKKTDFLTKEGCNKSYQLKKSVIHALIKNGDTTIANISHELEISVPTVTKSITELYDDGFIKICGKLDTAGGRKPNIYGLNPDSAYFVGVDPILGINRLHIACTDFKGNLVELKKEIPFQLEDTEESLIELCELINDFIDELSIPREKILVVGFNFPGRINPFKGVSYTHFNYINKPLTEYIEDKIAIHVNLDNDSRSTCYGEYMQGVVDGEKNIVFINFSWGLGSGYIINDRLHYGKSGFSGEIGHMYTFDNEILCYCGKKGCLETEVSGIAFKRKVVEQYHKGHNTILSEKIDADQLEFSDILEALKKEDVLCIDIIEEMGEKLGKSISGLINVFNPELVVVGGLMATSNEYSIHPIITAVRKYSLNIVRQDTKVKISKLGDSAGAIGACLLSRSRILGLVHL